MPCAERSPSRPSLLEPGGRSTGRTASQSRRRRPDRAQTLRALPPRRSQKSRGPLPGGLLLNTPNFSQQPDRADQCRGELGSAETVDRRDRQPALSCHRLNLDETSDPFQTLASAETGVLHSAHRGIDAAEGCREALIDVDRAAFDLSGNPPAISGISGPDTGVESVLGI